MIDSSEQLYILKEYGFDYLDKILTEEDLINNPESLDMFLPWSKESQENCKVK